jgi:phospholipase C
MASDRRTFLRSVAATAGAGASLSLFPPSIQRALAAAANNQTGTIKDVAHVVILMQENRAFDHYFGTLRGVRGFGDRFPIPLEGGKDVWFQSDGTRVIAPYHRDSRTSNALLAPGTPHAFADMQAAWNQGKTGFWPKYKTAQAMGHYRRADIPFQFALADAFTLCDAYHCSVTTGTDPNRIVFWSGSSYNPELGRRGINCQSDQGEPDNDRCWITGTWVDGAWPSGYRYSNNAFTWDTIPDLLQRSGISWRIFQDMNDNWTGAMHGCNAFATFRNARPGTPIYENGMSTWTIDDLKRQVMADTLPQVCWVLPSQATSEHPAGPSSPTCGANFTQEVLDALTANPEVWSKTVFLVTFDENDGFFDHVPPPALPSYNADGTPAGKATLPLAGEYFYDPGRKSLAPDDTISGTTRPWGMSARVPMYVVSPWSKGGWVDSQLFDHTSVAMFLEKRFGIRLDTISPWHRAVSGDLTSCFDFVTPNDPVAAPLPDMRGWLASDIAQEALPESVAPPVTQPLFQEPGVRFSRALPYELQVHGKVVGATGNPGAAMIELAFANSGAQGAVFHVYDKLDLAKIPRRYTVEAGKQLDDAWQPHADGAYDLWVLGPNGFHRHFTGNADAAIAAGQPNPGLSVACDVAARQLVITLTNTGARPVAFTLTPNAYVTRAPLTVRVAPHGQARIAWSVAATGGWYDLDATVQDWPGYRRRVAGRMETGAPSVSDPAMATQL